MDVWLPVLRQNEACIFMSQLSKKWLISMTRPWCRACSWRRRTPGARSPSEASSRGGNSCSRSRGFRNPPDDSTSRFRSPPEVRIRDLSWNVSGSHHRRDGSVACSSHDSEFDTYLTDIGDRWVLGAPRFEPIPAQPRILERPPIYLQKGLSIAQWFHSFFYVTLQWTIEEKAF